MLKPPWSSSQPLCSAKCFQVAYLCAGNRVTRWTLGLRRDLKKGPWGAHLHNNFFLYLELCLVHHGARRSFTQGEEHTRSLRKESLFVQICSVPLTAPSHPQAKPQAPHKLTPPSRASGNASSLPSPSPGLYLSQDGAHTPQVWVVPVLSPTPGTYSRTIPRFPGTCPGFPFVPFPTVRAWARLASGPKPGSGCRPLSCLGI